MLFYLSFISFICPFKMLKTWYTWYTIYKIRQRANQLMLLRGLHTVSESHPLCVELINIIIWNTDDCILHNDFSKIHILHVENIHWATIQIQNINIFYLNLFNTSIAVVCLILGINYALWLTCNVYPCCKLIHSWYSKGSCIRASRWHVSSH